MNPKIIINPIGGLANRMRAIAGGIALAQRFGVEYRIVWSKNWELNAEFTDIFKISPLIEGRIEYPHSLRYALIYSMPRRKNAYVSAITLKRYGAVFLDSFRQTSGRIVDAVENILQRGKSCYIQSGLTFYEFSEDLYREIFQPTDEVMRRVYLKEKEMGENRVGLHIRRTDNAESIRCSTDSLFVQEIDRILSQDATVKFYLATDSEDTKRIFTEKYPNKIIVASEEARRDTKEGIVNAMTEMILLSRTKEILGSYYSSYSEAAALLGNVPLRQLCEKSTE